MGGAKALAEAMRLQTAESPAIKSRMDDVAKVVAAVKQDLLSELPKMCPAGRTDVSELNVTANALTPIAERLYAVA